MEPPKAKKVTKIEDALKGEGKKPSKTVKKIVVSSPAETEKKDLTAIKGIGPKIKSILNQAGITTIDQLAAADAKELNVILGTAEPRFKSIDPMPWIEQAKMLK